MPAPTGASTRREVIGALSIEPDDFVVEIGGGHEPFSRSDLILDKYPFDEEHRTQPLVHAAPVIIADAHRMPLADGGCDLLFASHIIEHLSEPDRFLRELQRCSTRVYLEFPAATRELMFAWSFHEWFVDARGQHLCFYKNDIPQLFGDFFHRNYDCLLDAWAIQRHCQLNNHVICETSELTWEMATDGAFEHLVSRSRHGKEKVNQAPVLPIRYTWGQLGTAFMLNAMPSRWLDVAVGIRRRRRRSSPQRLTQELVRRLICLQCRVPDLQLGSTEIVCGACGKRYVQRGGLFDFDCD